MSDGTLGRCVEAENEELDPNRKIPVVPKKNERMLNKRQLTEYKQHRLQFLAWLLKVEKKEKKAMGYSPYTVYADSQQTAVLDKVIWKTNGGDVVPPTTKVGCEVPSVVIHMREFGIAFQKSVMTIRCGDDPIANEDK